ncbi:MAG TPA: aminotransferase class V-fold PLP-dependent enzyme [Blastocatellia bacterium]|nr:aminotransferase class V-fold PLP-dependent enzyme [Blastocatellia bacterium]
MTKTTALALEHLAQLPDRPVAYSVSYAELLERLGGDWPDQGEEALHVIEALVQNAAPGIVATPGPRYFGFVTGGVLPASLAADWLTSTWDQNAFSYVLSPAATAVEEIIRGWLMDVLGLTPEMSMGIVTGGTMANFTALAAARHALLNSVGWDVEANGLFDAPALTVITSEESHITIFAALQMLGLGRERVIRIPTDAQGRMRVDELSAVLARLNTPVLVCAQAGNVNTGSFDPIAEIVPHVRQCNGWLHVDGAFGGWVAAAPSHRHLLTGIEQADSFSVDGHKWLNVPYDSGLVFVRDPASHAAAMTLSAAYYVTTGAEVRENHNYVPEASRRARGFAIYAALRALGRSGIAAVITRCCRLARRLAEALAQDPQVSILNDVVINQVLVRFAPPDGGDADAFTAAVIHRVQQDGTCWAGGTTWQGKQALRFSVSNWSTTEEDIDRSGAAILACLHDQNAVQP